MSPITRSKTSLIRWRYPDFPTFQDLEEAYKIAYPKIQDDAKQLLEMMIEEQDVRKHYYNPTSPEYWFINNKESLEEVVYYKMKKRLILRYKKQLIEKGVDLSEYSDTESEFGGEPPPTIEELLSKESISNEVQDDDELMASSSTATNSPSEITFRDIPTRGFKFISSEMKKDESNTTVLNDRNIHRELRVKIQTFLHGILPNLVKKNFLFAIFTIIIILFIIGFLTNSSQEYINTQRQKNLIKGKLHGTVKAQVQEFIDQEISRVSKGLIENTDEDNDFIGFVRTQLNEVFQEQLEIFMDGGAGADFALISGGARIIHKLTSRTYELWPSKTYQKLLGRFTNNIIKSKTPETVISPNINVGECWCFNGTNGQIAIKLSRSIILTHVTYHHIGREVSIDPVLSAPKEFELWGLPTVEMKGDVELEKNSLGIFRNEFNFFLGRYQYKINEHPERPTQTFTLPDSIAKSNKRISAIIMKVINNHENPQFTCLYRLQVHGVMPH